MRKAASSAYLSSWQQRIVDGPYTDGTFKPYIAIIAWHYVRWLLNNVYSIVASSKMTNVATMVMNGWQGARSGADWPIAATATGQVFMAQALLFVSLQTAATWRNTVPSHALNISAHYILIVYNMTCTTRSTLDGINNMQANLLSTTGKDEICYVGSKTQDWAAHSTVIFAQSQRSVP